MSRNPMEFISNNLQNEMNKNLEHCSLSKVKQFDSGLILGENRKSREKYIEKMSEKVKKWSKKWSEIFGSI